MNLLRIVFGLSILAAAGCSMAFDATHLVAYQIRQAAEEHEENRRNEKWAAEAYAVLCSAHGPLPQHYEVGFKEGFTHYVATGWNEPPPIAPKEFRATNYQSPEGHLAIQQWFAGYRAGIDTARAGGYRTWVTGPTSIPPAALERRGPQWPMVVPPHIEPASASQPPESPRDTSQGPPPLQRHKAEKTSSLIEASYHYLAVTPKEANGIRLLEACSESPVEKEEP